MRYQAALHAVLRAARWVIPAGRGEARPGAEAPHRFLASPEGLEPPTPCFVGKCSDPTELRRDNWRKGQDSNLHGACAPHRFRGGINSLSDNLPVRGTP